MQPMMTRDQLAELLSSVSVEEVSKKSGLSTKTIYRLRHKQHAPTLDTVEKIVSAVSALTKPRRAKAGA